MRASLCPITSENNNKKTPQLQKEENTAPLGLVCRLAQQKHTKYVAS
jgi:hypothetical protein